MRHPTRAPSVVIGIDLGTKKSTVCVLSEKEVVKEFEIVTRAPELRDALASLPPGTVVMEVGTNSRWVSRLVADMGFEVVVVVAESLKDAFKTRGRGRRRKTDACDAEALARLYAADPSLMRQVIHRPEPIFRDLALLRARDHLVRMRTRAVLHIRGVLRALGVEIPQVGTESFAKKIRPNLSKEDAALVDPHFVIITTLTDQIRTLERKLSEVAAAKYPETQILETVTGVGAITSLAFVLIIGHKERFKRNRDVGAYLGLVPRKHASGDLDPELSITKAGDALLRRLLVQCAQYIIGRRCTVDSDLRRFGLKLAQRGRKNAKKRATVAVARKLAVLLLSIWKSRAEYVPLRNATSGPVAA